MLSETPFVRTTVHEASVDAPAPMDPFQRDGVGSSRSFRVRTAAVAAGSFAILSGLLGYVAYFPLHNQFQPYDDEGYWLISLRSYHEHGSLYHDTFAQVGPLYYEFWSLIYSITGLPVNADTGRAFTLGVWILTSVVFGISVFWLTRRLVLGFMAQILSFLLLLSLTAEPMEPAGLAHLFVAFALLGVTIVYRGRCRLGMTIIGVFTMAAVLTKINVGLFMAGGVVYALIVCWPSNRFCRLRRAFGGVCLLAVPVALMVQIVSRQWVQQYMLIELFALAGLIAMIGIQRRPALSVPKVGIMWCGCAAVATSIVVTMGVLVNGTTFGEFVSGALLSQRGLAKVATIPLPSTRMDVLIAGISAALAVVVAVKRFVPGALIRLVVGCWLCFCLVADIPISQVPPSFPSDAFVLAAPFAWLALAPRSKAECTLSFERIAICTAGILGYLEAFPGAGSQRTWAHLLLVPVALLCISDGLEMVPLTLGHRALGETRRHVASVVLVVAALVVLVPIGIPARDFLSAVRSQYYEQPHLGLPGAETLRLPPAQISTLRQVTGTLKAHCSAFESIPGVNSFYFFTGQDPPTGFNTTQWWKLLDAQQEEAAVTSLEKTERPCVLVVPWLIGFWDSTGQDSDLNRSPLMRYVQTRLVLLRTLGTQAESYSVYGTHQTEPARR
jgi:hypothetical protein